MSTKREQRIDDLKALERKALNGFDEVISTYLNRIKAVDIATAQTNWRPGGQTTDFLRDFKYESCSAIIENLKALHLRRASLNKRIDDLSAIYDGVIELHEHVSDRMEDVMSKCLIHVKKYVTDKGLTPTNGTSIIVVLHKHRLACKYTWSMRVEKWRFEYVEYDDMCEYFEFQNKE